MSSRGFTLIELLVVVAIIGILSGTVISAVGIARERAANATIKANLGGIRSQAEIYREGAGNYTSVCSDAKIVNALNGSNTLSLGTAVCQSTAAEWAAVSPLRTGGFWCIDSQGVARGETQGGTAYAAQTDALTDGSDMTCN